MGRKKVAAKKTKAQVNQKSGKKKQAKGNIIRGKWKRKKQSVEKVIDCVQPYLENVLDLERFEKYLKEHIKVAGKTNNLGTQVEITSYGAKIFIYAKMHFSSNYLRFIIKTYLKKLKLIPFMKVVVKYDNFQLQYLSTDIFNRPFCTCCDKIVL